MTIHGKWPVSWITAIAALPGLLMIGEAQAQKGQTPFDEKGGWHGVVNIAPGKYSPRHQIILGGKANPQDEGLQPATVTTSSVTEIEEANIFLDEGTWAATGTRFADCEIRIDLGGALQAKNSLFENCVMGKGGAWFVAFFSSKWTFHQCVFTGQFIEPIQNHDIGIQATNCTFFDIDLSPVAYREDAGTERLNEWMQVENCRFVRCKVPERFLLMTENCVFDGCTFGRAEDGIPMNKPVTMTVNLINPTSSKPKAGANRVFEVIAGDIASAGASEVRYRRSGKSLRFE